MTIKVSKYSRIKNSSKVADICVKMPKIVNNHEGLCLSIERRHTTLLQRDAPSGSMKETAREKGDDREHIQAIFKEIEWNEDKERGKYVWKR